MTDRDERIDSFREEVIKERAELMAENARFRMALEVIKAGETNVSARSVATIALFLPGED